jgi:hypothetical protein
VTTSLAAMSLVAPAMLAGAAFVAFPVIAHLLHRNARRPVVFPSIRLLRASSANQSSLFRLRRRALLLLRCLIVALLALAFAEPLWSVASADATDHGGTTVVVLDASASTDRREGVASLFDRLRSEAIRTIDALDGGRDVAEIIVADDAPRGLAGMASPNLAMVAELARDVRPSGARADMGEALGLAGQLLSSGPAPHRLVVLTDGQATNWNEIAGANPAAGASLLPAGTVVNVAVPGDASESNIGIEPRGVSQRQAAPGQPIAARVRVRAFGEASRATLVLSVDGVARERRELNMSPGTAREESFQVAAEGDGPHAIEWSVERDDLPADDSACDAFVVGGRQPIVILSDEAPDDPERATYFLVRALAPYGNARDRFAPRVIPLARFTPAAIADARAIVVSDLTPMSASQIGTLAEHLARGGSVIWFCGGGALAQNLDLLESRLPGILPFRPGAVSETEGRLVAGAARSALFASFDEPAIVGLGQIRIGRVRSCTLVRDDAMHILAFENGTPALSVRRVGGGAFALANFSAAPRVGDLGRHGAFVALVQSLVTELQPGDGALRPTFVGESLSIGCGPIAPGERAELRLLLPDGTSATDAFVLEDRTESTVTLPRPRRSGIYRAVRGTVTVAIGVVNADPRESDTAALSADAIRAAISGLVASGAGPSSPASAPSSEAGQGEPLWWLALLAALAGVALEMTLIAWWRR